MASSPTRDTKEMPCRQTGRGWSSLWSLADVIGTARGHLSLPFRCQFTAISLPSGVQLQLGDFMGDWAVFH